MKDKPIAVIITLIGGAVACICCICKEAGLFWTLLMTFVSLIIFMGIGSYVSYVLTGIKKDIDEQDKQKAREEEQARILAAAEADNPDGEGLGTDGSASAPAGLDDEAMARAVESLLNGGEK